MQEKQNKNKKFSITIQDLKPTQFFKDYLKVAHCETVTKLFRKVMSKP